MHAPNRFDFPVLVDVYLRGVHLHRFDGMNDSQKAYFFVKDTVEPQLRERYSGETPWICKTFEHICTKLDEYPVRRAFVAGNDVVKIAMRYKLQH